MINIAHLSQVEKLQLMEALWDDLTHYADAVNSPDWHRVELEKTEQAYQAGEVKSYSLDEAKALLRRN